MAAIGPEPSAGGGSTLVEGRVQGVDHGRPVRAVLHLVPQEPGLGGGPEGGVGQGEVGRPGPVRLDEGLDGLGAGGQAKGLSSNWM